MICCLNKDSFVNLQFRIKSQEPGTKTWRERQKAEDSVFLRQAEVKIK